MRFCESRQPDAKHLSLRIPFHLDLGSLCSPAECYSLDSPFVEVEGLSLVFSRRQELIGLGSGPALKAKREGQLRTT